MRSTHAAPTVAKRSGVSCANEAPWSAVKHTTSQRPTSGLSEGKRFSNTATS
jgi:hypothetical protein